MLRRYRWLLILGVFSLCGVFISAVEFFELGPIDYSKSKPDNKVSQLEKKKFDAVDGIYTDIDFLKHVLEELDVSEDTQLLVYSKTSEQKRRIFPRYPRALYFSDSCYVGYIPGGSVEVIAHDPELGLVFYLVEPDNSNDETGYRVTRKVSCLSCHVSSRTRGVPGLFARSVSTDDKGEADLKRDSFDVDDTTPLKHRWGGWYVTGNWGGITHKGNDFYGESSLEKLKGMQGRIEASRYLKDTSDIVALMVFEHQCKMHTILVESKFQYLRAKYLENALRMIGEVKDGDSSAFRSAKSHAEEIVEGLLFCGEAEIEGHGIEGDVEFSKEFTAQAKLSKSGKHLRKFRLYGRLFKYRCSYMIHSEAFAALPEVVKKLTFQRLHTVLTAAEAPEKYQHLKKKEKRTILEIIEETTPIKQYLLK